MFLLAKKAFAQIILLFCFMSAPLFLSAGSFDDRHIWGYLAAFFTFNFAMTIYLLMKDPALLGRRIKGKDGEKGKEQKILRRFGTLFVLGTFIVAGLDYRHHWSNVPINLVIVGYVVLVTGYALFFLVVRENSFASSVIEVDSGQTVITTGPYRTVRHPMYIGSVLTYIGTPFVLGSWWALVFVLPLTGIIVARLVNEEKFLSEQLPGYTAYCQKTRYRLIPFIW